MSEEELKTEAEKVHFAVMAIGAAADMLGISPSEMQQRLERAGIVKGLLFDLYEVEHTLSLKHVAEDVIEALKKEFAANNILLYGEAELNNREFIDFINKLDIIPEDNSWYRTKVDLKTGKVSKQEVRLQSQTFNNFTWFEYNYMLIGRPNKIIIYECPDIYRRVPQFNK